MARRSAPRSSRWVAKEWRSVCGLSVARTPARRPYAFNTFQKPTRVRPGAPPRAFPNKRGRVHEQPRTAAFAEENGTCVSQISAHPGRRLIAERHDALLAALAGACQIGGFQIDVAGPQRNQFRHTQAGGVQQLDERAVAEATRARYVGL